MREHPKRRLKSNLCDKLKIAKVIPLKDTTPNRQYETKHWCITFRFFFPVAINKYVGKLYM